MSSVAKLMSVCAATFHYRSEP